ncbi:hypothetical protein [Erythrobacter sp. SD-21]|uniref:hypothetical protein n=1 Tax=Erythrobacter sp. SD-21 TaxID=161528 RepID=UPI000153F5BA|nr:hypothetical protein [Erythrobacter sp. SD-21]EDL48515.1 hypothetical protein ED21_29959 [Erythrobacter sp. SD-21]
MDYEKRELDHELKNAEQQKLALKGLVKRAADEIDDLADANCSEEAVESAKAQAKRLREATKSISSGD